MKRRIFRDGELDSRFDAEGFVVVPVLDDHEVAALSRFLALQWSGLELPYYASLYSPHGAYRRAVDAEIKVLMAPRLEQLLVDYHIHLGLTFVKHPGHPAGNVGLHQDASVVDESLWTCVHAWCPLIDTDRGTGGLVVIPGSHRLRDCVRPIHDAPERSPFHLLVSALSGVAQPVPVRAGHAVLFHGGLLHGSPMNRGNHVRTVAAAISLPREATFLCHWRVAPDRVERFDCSHEFFMREDILSKPSRFVTSRGVLPWSAVPVDPAELPFDVAIG